MGRIETWKKIISVVGVITQTTGYFINSKTLMIVGLISVIVGMILIFMLK